jgi:hypothetical protein
MHSRHLVASAFVALLAAAALSGVAAAGSNGTPNERTRQRLQQCVDRWNVQHIWFWAKPGTSVQIKAGPCRTAIQYSYVKTYYFPCSLNRAGAYSCASHAFDPAAGDPPGPTSWNATTSAAGVLRLLTPPRRTLANHWPNWMRAYPLKDGYIVPLDSSGTRRPGITIAPETAPSVGPGIFGCAGGGALYGTYLSCGAGAVCFAVHLPVHTGDRLVCAAGPEGGRGSTKFQWATLSG